MPKGITYLQEGVDNFLDELEEIFQLQRLVGKGLQKSICQGTPINNAVLTASRGSLRNYTTRKFLQATLFTHQPFADASDLNEYDS